MYAAFVISEFQYKFWVSRNKTVKVIWVKRDITRSREASEEVYFQFSYDTLCFCVVSDIAYMSEFIRSKVVLDVTDVSVCINIVEYARNVQYSKSEYIYACNQLRDKIATMMDEYRVCGPEFECLFNSIIVKNCTEMVGLHDKGIYMLASGESKMHEFYIKHDDVYEEYQYVQTTFADVGQRKLYSLFAGFVQRRRVVYIGAAPGESWLDYAITNRHDVLAFDPRPLSHHRLNKTIGRMHIIHIKYLFTRWEQIEAYIGTDENFDLIWDVRGDWESDEQYEEMVKNEILLLNELLTNIPDNCIRLNIKIRYENLNSYNLPEEGNFYMLPWVIDRRKRELRYVFRNNVTKTTRKFIKIDKDKATNFIRGIEKEYEISANTQITNAKLYMNSKLMRLDRYDYMQLKSISERDLNLFTINLNEPASIRAYLEENKGVISFFLEEKLEANEYKMPYTDELLKFAVVDTRVFIGKRIPNLRILIPKDLTIYADEILTSSNFRIMSLGNEILNKYGLIAYHNAKKKAAVEERKVFARFPEEFSICDNLITPSGHAMRMVYHDRKYRDFSMLEYFPKILYSFWQGLKSRKRLALAKLANDKDKLKFANICQRSFEPHKGEIWHSLSEWQTGIRAGELLIGCDDIISKMFKRYMLPYTNLLSEYYGVEIFNWRRQMHLPIRMNNIEVLLAAYGYDPGDLMYDQLLAIERYIEATTPGINLETKMGMDFNKGKDFLSNRSALADFLITNFRLDYYIRYVIYHRIAVRILGRGEYPEHDMSKFDYFELLWYNAKFNLKLQDSRMNDKWNDVVNHHYQNNPHHPQYWGSKSMPDSAFREHMVDLLAMCWLHNNPNEEIFYPRRHTEILLYVVEHQHNRMIEMLEDNYKETDFFLMETMREDLKNESSIFGVEHP